MAPITLAKRKRTTSQQTPQKRSRPTQKFRKQQAYSSGSSSASVASDDDEDVLGSVAGRTSTSTSRPTPTPVTATAAATATAATATAVVTEHGKNDPSLSAKAKSKPKLKAKSKSKTKLESRQSDSQSPSASDPPSDSDSDSDSHHNPLPPNPTKPPRPIPKRHDPSSFASSLSAILTSSVPASHRADPVLARSKAVHDALHAQQEAKLDAAARRVLRRERRGVDDKGRVRDVLVGDRGGQTGARLGLVSAGLMEGDGDGKGQNRKSRNDGGDGNGGDGDGGVGAGKGAGDGSGTATAAATTQQITMQESQLRKTAQRGVVKLFNAVRAAQVKVEEMEMETRGGRWKGVGTGGKVGERERKIGEMEREAFLEMVARGGIEG